ncbi:hypothetical protein [Croceimicrobium sp.]|uniref:hypothetical protein n=1 Tax=Croceimicrobium sp. TaxID=2828340 RepID=UPI003BAC271A
MRGFLISSNLWVGLAVGLLSLMSFPAPWSEEAYLYALFLLLATSSAYSYMRWVKIAQQNTGGQPSEVAGFEQPIAALMYSLFMGLASLYVLRWFYSWDLVIALAPAVVVAILYPLAFPHPNRHFTSLRTIPMLKLLLISATWAWLSFALPMLHMDQIWTFHFYLELLFRTFLVAGLTIPFDIRDMDYDLSKMKTIPQLMGVDASLQLANFFLLLYQLWTIAAYFIWDLSLALAIAWLVGLEIGAYLIRKVRHNRSEIYIGFWVEAIPIIVFILLLLAQWAWGIY